MDSGYRKPITTVTRRDDIPIRDLTKRKQCINFTTVTLSSKAKQKKGREAERKIAARTFR
jgi:hypothetical protein